MCSFFLFGFNVTFLLNTWIVCSWVLIFGTYITSYSSINYDWDTNALAKLDYTMFSALNWDFKKHDNIGISRRENEILYLGWGVGKVGDSSNGISSRFKLIRIGGNGGCLGGSWDFINYIM